MSVKELQEYTRIAKYARYNEKEKRRESWNEQIDRVIDMHKSFYADVLPTINHYIDETKYGMKKKLILGSQRALQYGGQAILDKNAKLYNCTASYCDRTRFFQETMWLMLCGCGVGFSVQKHHVAQLPDINLKEISSVPIKTKTIVIEDSIEGWADAIGQLLSSYFVNDVPFPDCQNRYIQFDYSEIRPEGSIIKSSGSKAPGPKGLEKAIEEIRKLLDNLVRDGSTRLRSIDAYDIVMHISDAVISGGIRRAATLCLFSLDDEEMMKAKTGTWHIDNPQRARSNNSVLLMRNETSKSDFKKIMENVKQFGEPGFVWADDKEFLVNPCCEIGFDAHDEITGKTGWAVCNLSTLNMKRVKTKEQFLDMCRCASILGTLQAGYTEFPYLGTATENIVKREALLGVSMTGMMDNPEISFDPELQKEGARLIKKINKEIANKIGIRCAARTTCIKPEGSASCILGTSSGIHPQHSKKYFRRVQANKLEEPLKYFKKINPLAVEESVWSKNNTDDVITFLCEVPANARTKVNINALELLDFVKLTQNNWVQYGKNKDLCVKGHLSHNVSNTINVKDDEWEEVTDYIYKYRKFFTGISLLPMDGDKDYPQAPFTTVYDSKEIVKEYGEASILASGLIVDGLRSWDDDLWAACDCVLGIGENLDIPDFNSVRLETKWKRKNNIKDKIDWIRRSIQFAERYFEGDKRKMTYCLKDVYNLKLWLDLKREYKSIEWSAFHEETDNTKISETIACSGGSCDLI